MKKNTSTVLYYFTILAFFWSFPINAGILPSQNNNTVAGFIDGDFDVTSNGAASYEIKIKTPPGTAGMQPELRLLYNNQGSNGLLGVGWSMGGLSSISRCPKTFAQDGIKAGINFDANDRFCIDGMRLVAVKGEYGAPGTQYSTEVEQWTRYYSYGNCGSSPCYFTAKAKDGSLTTYGNTDDSRILASGKSEVRIWAVNKREDLNQNYIAVSYINKVDGEYYPAKISYTGNNKANLAATRSIRFEYDTNRPDPSFSYVAGTMVKSNARLLSLSTYVDDSLVKKYNINYIISNQTNRSLISSISECGNDGSCLAPTTFSWNNVFTSNHSVDYQDWGQGTVYQKGAVQSFGDFNADGATDIGYIYNNSGKVNIDVYLSTGKTFKRASWYAGTKNWQTGQFVGGDYNGDGISDIASVYSDSGRIAIDSYLSDKNSFALHSTYTSTDPYDQKAQVLSGDINGDGIADIVYASNDSGKIGLKIYLGHGATFAKSASLSVSSGTWTNEGRLYTGDFNDDGLTDLAWVYNDAGKVGINLYISDGNTLRQSNVKISDLTWTNDALFSFSDYNGDGKTDIAWFFNNSGKTSAQVLISQGDTFLSTRWLDSDIVWGGSSIVKSSDYNGDSKVDVAYVYRGENDKVNIDSFLSTGTSFTKFSSIQSQGNWGDEQFIPSDFNADGLADIVNSYNQSGKLAFTMYLSTDNAGQSFSLPQSDLLSKIVNGANKAITVDYKPLTFGGVYEKAQQATFPSLDVQIPYYIVASLKVYEPISNTTAISQYYYKGAQVDLQGRGWQGFSTITARNVSNTDATQQTDTRSSYYQNFPLTGLLKQQRISRVSDGAALWQIDYLYGNVASESSPPVNVVYKTEKNISSYSNGTFNYSQKEKYSYDKKYAVVTQTDYVDGENGNNYFSCSQYKISDNNDNWWYAFYKSAEKVVKTADGCQSSNFSEWNAKTDLRFYLYGYDENLNINSLSQWNDQRDEFSTTRADYDDVGNIIARTDALGNKTQYAYDDQYHTFLVSTTSPAPAEGAEPLIVKSTFEPEFGIQTSQQDANNNTVMKIPADGVDMFGRVIRQESIKPDSTDMVTTAIRNYTAGSNASVNIKQALRNDWNQNDSNNWFWEIKYYDGLGRLYQHASQGPVVGKDIITNTDYDAQGLKRRESLPYYSGDPVYYTEYQFDIKKRTINTLYPTGAAQSVHYHETDNRVIDNIAPNPAASVTDKATIATTMTVDNNGNKIRNVAPNTGITTYSYDVLNQKLTETDPSGSKTSFTYTSLGLISQITDPERGTTSWTYNNAGKPETVVNALGQKTQYSYDALLRVTKAAYYSADGKLIKTIAKTYDTATNGKGRLASLSTPDITWRYKYYYNGNIAATTATLNIAGAVTDYTTTYTYDPLGRQIASGLPDGSSVASILWPTGATKTLSYTDPAGASKTLVTYGSYDALGDLTQASFSNGIVASYGHDVFGRLISEQLLLGVSNIRNFNYQWNLANKILSISDQRISPKPSLSQQLQYDKMGYLISSSGVYGDISYQYNLSGDITSENNIAYTYDASKKHQLISGCVQTQGNCDNVLKLAYDDTGNVTTKTTITDGQSARWDYRYDVSGNLSQVTRAVNGGTSSDLGTYAYGNNWQRVSKTNADGSKVFYISPNYVVLLDAAGAQSVDKYLTTEHGIVTQISALGTNYFHLNNVNSSTLITSDKGVQNDGINYKPFGSIDKASSDITTSFIPKFTGKELDDDSELYYFGARYYDASLNRFMAPDPARQFASPYAYGNNDPMVYTDPDGRVFGIDDAIEIAIVAEVATDVAVESAVATTTAAVATGEATSAIGLAVETEAGVSAIASAASVDATGIGIEAAQAEVASTISTESIVSGTETLNVSTGINISTQTETADTAAQSFAESAMNDNSVSSLEKEEGLARDGGENARPGDSYQQIRSRPRNDLRIHYFSDHRVYTSTGRISASGVRSALLNTSSNESVLVFSGTHGTADGYTAAEYGSLEELTFAQEDSYSALSVGGQGEIHVADVGSQNTNIASWEINNAIRTGTYRGQRFDCVIGGFCYSEVRYNYVQGKDPGIIGGYRLP